MALSRGKPSIVAPVTNALAPVLTITLSLLVYRTLPSPFVPSASAREEPPPRLVVPPARR